MEIATEPRIVVAVRPARAHAERPRLLAALEAAFPVRFVPWAAAGEGADAVLAVGDAEGAPSGLPTFVVRGDAGGAAEAAAEAVRLGSGPAVDPTVRDVVLHDRLAGPALDAGQDDVLALAAGAPAWTRTRAADAARPAVHRVRAVLPELAADEVLYALLSRRALASVALVHFLRELTSGGLPQRRPLRAAFVFDDPNLRWRSYGFIDYRRLVAHADAHGYHVAMAMIPLDAGRAHRPTAALFRERSDRLSLVVHGNDHVRHELLGPSESDAALTLAAQALRRIERFERRSGVPVDRIMMPPHGRCSEAMARALAAVGFDALCAIHPLPWTAERPTEPPLAAWRPAEFVGGCAVIPRTPLTSTPADLALRAFLDHPLVVYGHHEDLAGGLEPLAEVAATVNRLGDVQWMSVGAIGATNFDARAVGTTLHVRGYSGRLAVTPPDDVAALTVDAPLEAGGAHAMVGWSLDGGAVRAFGETAAVERSGGEGGGGRPREIRLHAAGAVDPATVAVPGWRPWPKLRRTGTELRDRALPLRPAAKA
jgi:hypothetical protein